MFANDTENDTIDFLKRNFFSEDVGNTFIAKLSTIDKEEKKKIQKRMLVQKNKKRNKIKKIKNIINHDQKVKIDCLLSRVKENIE